MEGFTKGPWFVAESDKFDHVVCTLSHSHSVYADIPVVNNPEHDAALIAAAPEMYEMLKRFADNNVVFPLNMRNDMHALLAKARGE